MIKCAEKTTHTELKNNISIILSNQFIKKAYPIVNINFMYDLAEKVSKKLLIEFLKKLMENPYDYGSGWPDLTVINDNYISFIEVKTSDKLLKSQVRFAMEIALPLGLNCEVFKLVSN